MQDHVADVLAQRAALDRGAGTAVVLSILLHAALAALMAYGAFRMPAPKPVRMVNIQFAKMPAAPAAPSAARAVARRSVPATPPAPTIEEPKPKILEPKPQVPNEAPTPEKNTVPLSPFGRSTKKGSENPEAAPPKPATAPPALGGPATATGDVPIGGTGVTGLEGGDFPFTLYIDGMQRRIGSNWFRGQVAPGTTTVVYFRILRDGTITEARVATPSGNATFDRAALSAVRSSNPLNPLPPAYKGNYLGVHLTFR